MIACGEAERVRIRRVGRRAGKIIGRAVRITVVDGLIAVWDEERGDNPLQVLIDRVRAEKLIDQAPKRRGPPGDEGFPFLPRADPVPRPEDRTDRP
ncbi:hypothetical protein Nans01_44640 [Nocardiopsis ansamitocini]|uniref:Uncharacterized protein n=1 Tax=Nocardiopsis ansamitocini TaxID=1670832 RepID=A0A9W6PAQ9_9ACTN|nr:hypothetical protein Nans01_44640 [Nocardiopsis ansamitocini]